MARCFGWVLGGAAGEYYTTGGQRDIDDSFLVMMNAHHEAIDFCMPALDVELRWEQLIDTALDSGFAEPGQFYERGESFRIQGRSMALFINRGMPVLRGKEPLAASVPDAIPENVEPPANDQIVEDEAVAQRRNRKGKEAA
jgi:glycogen operon protein